MYLLCVLVSWGCPKKLPHTQWLKVTNLFSHSSKDQKSEIKSLAGCIPLCLLGGESFLDSKLLVAVSISWIPWLVATSLHFCLCLPIICVAVPLSLQYLLLYSHFPLYFCVSLPCMFLCVSIIRIFAIGFTTHLNNPEWFPHPRTLHLWRLFFQKNK